MIFKYFEKRKRRKLFTDAIQDSISIDKELKDIETRLGVMMAMPQFDVLVEYLEAQIESLRDVIELDIENKDTVRVRAKIEVYRDLIAMFGDIKEKQSLEDSNPLES